MSSRPHLTVASPPFTVYRTVPHMIRKDLEPTRDKLLSDILYACKIKQPEVYLRPVTSPPGYDDPYAAPNGLTERMFERVELISDRHINNRGYLSDLKEGLSPADLGRAILNSLNEPQDNETSVFTPSSPYTSLVGEKLYVGLSFEGNKPMNYAFKRARDALDNNLENCSIQTAKPYLILGAIAGANLVTYTTAEQAANTSMIRYSHLPISLGPLIASGDIFHLPVSK